MKAIIVFTIAIFAPIALHGAADAPKGDLIIEVQPDGPDKPEVPRIVPGRKYTVEIQRVPRAERRKWICGVTEVGWINLPFVDRIKIGGMTLREAERAIEDHYRKRGIYTKPRILLAPVKDGLKDAELKA